MLSQLRAGRDRNVLGGSRDSLWHDHVTTWPTLEPFELLGSEPQLAPWWQLTRFPFDVYIARNTVKHLFKEINVKTYKK